MWIPERTNLIKVLLHDNGEDVETPWAEDLGPHPAKPWTKLVRLANVPFLHAKPTYEDVIVVEEDDVYGWSWNCNGTSYEEIGTRIHEDSGRWAMILDYRLIEGAGDLTSAFHQLDKVGEAADIAVEGAFANEDEGTGRAYFAVSQAYGVEEALRIFSEAGLPLEFKLEHPADDE